MSLFLSVLLAVVDPGLAALQALDLRIATLGNRIAVQAAPLCPDKAPQTGLLLHSLGQYAPAVRPMMAADFGVQPLPTVEAVVPGSAADKAGLRAGDAIAMVNGMPMPRGVSDKARFEVVETAEDAIDAALLLGRTALSVERAGWQSAVMIEPVLACPSRFQVMPSKKSWANAAGRYVQISTRVIERTQDDDELAFILAHEMAHNILKHKELLDAQGRRTSRVRMTETEADALGVKLMQAAGFDPFAASRFWARAGKKMDAGIFSDGTHMRVKARTAFLRAQAEGITAPN